MLGMAGVWPTEILIVYGIYPTFSESNSKVLLKLWWSS